MTTDVTRCKLRSRNGRFLLMVLLLCLRARNTGYAHSYSIKGELRYELQKREGQNEPLFRHFELQCDDCRWKITVELDRSTNLNAFVYQYDGTNITYYSRSAPPNSPKASGMVEACPVPQTWVSAAGEYVWLAFASARYFEGASNGLSISLNPLFSPSGHLARLEVPTESEVSVLPPHLPVEIQYLTDHFSFLGDNDVIETKSLPAELVGGFVSGHFKSSRFTNIGNLSFPTSFEYRAYIPSIHARNTNDLRCSFIVAGLATNIVVAPQAFDMGLPVDLPIRDLRIPEAAAVLRVTNGVIPSTNSLEVVRARSTMKLRVEANKKMQEEQRRRSSVWGRRGVSLCAFLALSVLPVLYLLFRRGGQTG